jgi:formate dehydrogenase subunit delta
VNAGGQPADAAHQHDAAEHLVKMANDIGSFFGGEPQREDAIAGISNHIAKYWTRRMREKLARYLAQGGDGLDELPLEAVRRLNASSGSA